MHYRAGTRAAAGIVIMGLTIIGIYLVHEANPSTPPETLGARVAVASVMLFSSWVIWRAAWRPHVRTDHQGLLVIVNPLWRWTIPIKAIEGVDSSNGLVLHLQEGQEVSVFAFSGSFLADIAGDKRARALKRLIKASTGAEHDQAVKRELDLGLVDAVCVMPLVLSMTVPFFQSPV